MRLECGMKAIFLDFDGVISVLETHWELSECHMHKVKEILDKTEAKIVISSSWRRDTVERTLEKIKERCDRRGNDYGGINFEFLLNKDTVVGVTKRLGCGSRGLEIKDWLSEHPEVDKYIILDDDTFDILPEQKEHLIHTAWDEGITDDDVKAAIEKLNG